MLTLSCMHKRFVSLISPDLLSWAILSHMFQQSLAMLSGGWFSRWIQNLKMSIANWGRICQVHLFNLNTSHKKMYTCFLNGVFIPAAIITFFHRFRPHNQSQVFTKLSYKILSGRANVILKCNSSLHCHKNGRSEKNMTCKLKLQRKGNRLFLPEDDTPVATRDTLVRVYKLS